MGPRYILLLQVTVKSQKCYDLSYANNKYRFEINELKQLLFIDVHISLNLKVSDINFNIKYSHRFLVTTKLVNG